MKGGGHGNPLCFFGWEEEEEEEVQLFTSTRNQYGNDNQYGNAFTGTKVD